MHKLKTGWGALLFCGMLLVMGIDWGDVVFGQAPDTSEANPAISQADKPLASRSEQAPERTYIGEYIITGYCACSKCCGKWAGKNTAAGTKPVAGRTVGADWARLPVGTELYIEGIGYRTVEDKPAAWISAKYDGKIIDVFCQTHTEAEKIGRQMLKVYLINK